MQEQQRQAVARELLAAYREGPIDPLIRRYPGLEVTDSYHIQLEQVRQWVAEGDVVRGHKVGLSSAAMQRQLGVNQPDYGHLLESMFHLEGLPIDTARYLQPKVEPEIGFVLGAPLRGPGVTAAEAAAAVRYVVPALEIIDSRIKDWRIALPDTIADNASSGGLVLGSRFLDPSAVDIRLTGCVLRKGGEVIDTGAGAAVLGSPLNSLVWLANTVGPLGITLAEGHVVLPGSLSAAHPVAPGESVTAEFAGLGSVTAVFGKQEDV
ncbi:2-keto-4-pentenoate hydratase [Sciscionella marina]|uniref:2-keto-4-pentenoate hydratase n=1 Tax=Sciscionella marina TaxID=508770 RepID=UPI000369C2CA|nr:fumarylacetoacetate hydrolase family protein [Sciscionella marina]